MGAWRRFWGPDKEAYAGRGGGIVRAEGRAAQHEGGCGNVPSELDDMDTDTERSP